jgi:hypothetical protein
MNASTAYRPAPWAPVASTYLGTCGGCPQMVALELVWTTNTDSSVTYHYSAPLESVGIGGPCQVGSSLMPSGG